MSVGNVSQREALSLEFKLLRREARITQQALYAISGVGTTTIKDIERGAAIPKPDTLRLLAEGFATDGAGNRCEAKARRYYNRLMLAAGYISELPPEPETPAEATPDPEAVLAELARDPELGALIASALRKYPAMTEMQKHFFVHALQSL